MRTTYNASADEARKFLDGTKKAIIVPMKVQPKDCFPLHQDTDEFCKWRNEPFHSNKWIWYIELEGGSNG